MTAGEPPRGFATVVPEGRFVALLSLDLVGSTLISDSTRPQDEEALLDEYRALVERCVDQKRTRIEWAGDGCLISFGFPEPRVDAAQLAVRSGLELIAAVQNITTVPQVRLQLRGAVECGRVTYDYLRRVFSRVAPASRADRLRRLALPGQLLIAEDTRHLVVRFFDYEDLGVVDLKEAGRRRVWRVVGKTDVDSRFVAQRLPHTTDETIGREDVLIRLSDAWSSALNGNGRAVCLVGDSGIGKSRLARTVLDWVKRDDGVALEIDCTPSTGNSPLFPIGVLLRRRARIGTAASDEEKTAAARALLNTVLDSADVADRLPFLAPLFGIDSLPLPEATTPDQVRAFTTSAVVDLLKALATRPQPPLTRPKPVAVLCEDLHWADNTTAQVVQTLAQVAHTMPLLLIVTRWQAAVTSIDVDSVTAAFETIPIEPLPRDNATRLVERIAAGKVPSRVVTEIVDRCGGVPLLLEELTRSTVEQVEGGTSTPASLLSDRAVPPDLQVVVESRLEHFRELRHIIQAASVLGREFPVSALAAMVGDGRESVEHAIEQFAEQGLFEPRGAQRPERAGFRHALLRDAVYETLVSRRQLRQLHSLAADVLDSQHHGTPDASPDVLAHHLAQAHRLDEAVKLHLAAGEQAFARGGYVEAAGHCDAATALLQELGNDTASFRGERFQLCVLLGMVAAARHGYSAVQTERAYRDAETMFDHTTGPDRQYPVVRGLATAALLRGELAMAHAISLAGLDLAERSQRPDYRIDAMSVVAYTTLYYGRLADCRTVIDRCLELYDQENGDRFRYPVPQDAKTAVLALLPTAAWLLGDADGAESAIANGLAHVERLGRDFDKALMHAWIAGTRYTQRRYHEALTHAGTAYAIAKEHNYQEWEATAGLMALLSQAALMPSSETATTALATANAFKANGVCLNRSYFLWGVARAFMAAGDHAAALVTLDDASKAAEASEETRMNPEIWMLRAELEPDTARSRQLLNDAYELAIAQGAVANALRSAAIARLRDGDDRQRDWARETLAILNGSSNVPPGGWMSAQLTHAGAISDAHFGLRD